VKRTLHHPCHNVPAGGLKTGRSAFTLLELMLALGILITLATLSWPGLMRSLKQQSVQGNAEQVRQVLDLARVRAVEEGRALQVRFEPHGKRYVLLPFDPLDESSQQPSSAAATTTLINQAAPVHADPFRVYEVSQGCYFHVDNALLSGETAFAERLGEEWMKHLENAAQAQDVAWSAPVIYYPDGSATDGTFVVMDQDRQYIKLHVRGLTGAVWAEQLAVMTERLGQTGIRASCSGLGPRSAFRLVKCNSPRGGTRPIRK